MNAVASPSPGLSSPRPYYRPPLFGSTALALTVVALLVVGLVLYLATARYHFTPAQVLEFSIYLIVGALGIPGLSLYFLLTRRSRKEQTERHPPFVVSRRRDAAALDRAWKQNAVVLGYNIHGEPWLWPDKVRVMQGIVLGQTGSGKTTLLKNIITQDFERRVGLPEIREHNEHVEVCNRVIESAETGRPVTPGASGPQWKAEMEALREKAETMEAANARLKAQLEAKEASLAALSARVDELARVQEGKPNGAGANSSPNLDLVVRVNRLTAELEALRDENKRLKRMNHDVSRSG